MFKFALNKLVRDRILELVDKSVKCEASYLSGIDRLNALKVKLYEELDELQSADDYESLVIEAADMLEVILNLTTYPVPTDNEGETLRSTVDNFLHSDFDPICAGKLLYAILETVSPISLEGIEVARVNKYNKAGSFTKGLFIHYMEIERDDPLYNRFISNPSKYKLVL